MKKKNIKLIICIVLILSCLVINVCAIEAPYSGYEYNYNNNAIPTPISYKPNKVLSGVKIDDNGIIGATDLFILDNMVYILDARVGRIIISTIQFEKFSIIEINNNRGDNVLLGATGLFVRNNYYYISNPALGKIYISTFSGEIVKEITRPISNLIEDSLEFKPSKVLVDSQGILYTILVGCYKGALTFSPDYEFIGFYGSAKISVTMDILSNYFWKSIFNDKQRSNMRQNIPIEFANFDISQKDFVFTVTSNTGNGLDQVQKFNPESSNILPQRTYADVERTRLFNPNLKTSFVDVKALSNDMFLALDSKSGKTFLYNFDGDLISVFGGIGTEIGLNMSVVAIDAYESDVFVLDPYLNRITMYSPTEYGENLLNAIYYYNKGEYEKSLNDWNNVLIQNSNSMLAYKGIGKAYLAKGEIDTALKNFKLAHDRQGYSTAFEPYRKLIAKKYIYLILILVLIIIIFLIKPSKKKVANQKQTKKFDQLSLFKKTITTLFHPNESFLPLIKNTKKIYILSIITLSLWFCLTILNWQYKGFIFNYNVLEKFNIFDIFASTIILFFVFCFSNWLFSTMLSGSGRMIDIIVVCSVSTIPYTIAILINLFISNFLVISEGNLLGLIEIAGLFWAIILLLIGMKIIHEFSLAKTILILFLTVIGMAIIGFVVILIWSLFQQISSFFSSIMDELAIIISNG